MPELPEVETLRRGLAPDLEGQRIQTVQLNRKDLRVPFPERLAKRLEGATIGPLGRRAKYLLLPLDTGETLIIHLGMSGRLLVEKQDAATNAPDSYYHQQDRHPKHDHVRIALQSGHCLIYNDVRRFGFMLLEETEALAAHPSLAPLGPEPLGNDFHAQVLLGALKGKATPFKSALLDQSIVAGLGNIYVCEALNRTRLSPFRAAKTLTKHEAEMLVSAIRLVLNRAIQLGGATISDHRQADGSAGGFQDEFVAYDRAGEQCRNPGCMGRIERQVQAGRSTFFCTQCQADD